MTGQRAYLVRADTYRIRLDAAGEEPLYYTLLYSLQIFDPFEFGAKVRFLLLARPQDENKPSQRIMYIYDTVLHAV